MRVNVGYTASCAEHGPMIADTKLGVFICLSHELQVSKQDIVQLILREEGSVSNSLEEVYRTEPDPDDQAKSAEHEI